LFATSALFAGDWPQWRGPERDGVAAPGAVLPTDLPAQLRRVWQVEVGPGYSGPVVVGDRVYVHSRQGSDEIVRALDLADGLELWRHASETPYRRNPAAFLHGKGPWSTPVVAGDSICTLGMTGRLTCLNRETGQVDWRKDFSERFDRTWPEFGTATSPAFIAGHLIAHVGGVKSGSLAAFDLADGREIWNWSEEGPGYASPVRWTLDGVEQIVNQSRAHVVSVAADTGELLWKMPFETAWDQNNVTPLVAGSRIMISGLDKGTTALEPRRDERGNWLLQVAWRNGELPMYMSSPVLHDGLIFGLTNKKKGQLFCLDAATGETLWTSEGREGKNASLIVAGDDLIVLTTEAELLIGPATANDWSPIARYTVADSPTWAHPAFLGDRIVVKDKTKLTLWAFD
ncbi:MAG: PQQ-like beta-propeller repeat protein, partial [Acidobacteria bacterium]|nr:PQQ-like beta-propeller repeat protein [Acidobacteriota bacterium]